ncbi:MAG TPA: FtsX-like permease family protein [Ilumatobacteraceae bacterium]|nr:FtsX-like permease family protein [Ilumatobacteraceae bacterium]
MRFALGDRNRVAARSAIISAVAATVAVVAAVTFAASLSRLVRVPGLFGWNFDAAVVSGNGYDNLDEARVHEILDKDFAVAKWSGVYFGADAVGDVAVPLIGMQPDSTVRPTLVEGRFLDDDTEIVLGQATARALHADVGDEVVLKGDGSPHILRVVGIAVLPTIGKTHAQHTSLGRGAIVVPGLVPGSDLDILGVHEDKPLGPNAVFVRFMPGVAAGAELAHLRQTTAPLAGFAGLDVLEVQRPAEIVSADEVGAAPVLLAIGLAIGATIALVIVLVTSVRSHRRELAVLTALGFTRKQRAATLMWHSTIVVTFGLLIGVPLGALVGRALWQVFAKRIDVPAPAVAPWGATVVIVLCALFLAVALGLGPARTARRLNVSAALRDQ